MHPSNSNGVRNHGVQGHAGRCLDRPAHSVQLGALVLVSLILDGPLQLGACGHFVRWDGRAYEALAALWERRRPQDLSHSALEVTGLGADS